MSSGRTRRHTPSDKADPLLPAAGPNRYQAPAPLEIHNSTTTDTMAPRSGSATMLNDVEAKGLTANDEVAMEDQMMATESSTVLQSSEPPPPPARGLTPYAYVRSAHALEMLACVGLYIATTVFTAMQPFPTNERPIPYQYLDNAGDFVVNQEYNAEKMGSTVSPTVVVIVALVVQIALTLGRRLMGLSFTYDLHGTVCSYMTALSLNRLATEWVKNYVGYMRPIFYETCVPSDDYSYCTDNDHGGRTSFPSGHASISFTGSMLLMLYIHNRLGAGHYKAKLERRRLYAAALMAANGSGDAAAGQYTDMDAMHNTNDFALMDNYGVASLPDDLSTTASFSYGMAIRAKLISLVALLPLAVAGMISADRVRTNHHFPADVVGGAVLGSSIAAFCFSLWF